MGERRVSSQQIVLEQLENHMQKNEVVPLPHSNTKINLNWINNLNINAKMTQLLEENMSEIFITSDLAMKS